MFRKIWRLKWLALPIGITLLGLLLVALMGATSVFGQAASDPQPQAAEETNAQDPDWVKGQGLPRAPQWLLNQARSAADVDNACQVLANTTPPTGIELFKGDHMVVSYMSISNTLCSPPAMVVNFNAGAQLLDATQPGKVCYTLDDTQSSALCTLMPNQIITVSTVVINDHMYVDIYSLGQPETKWWQGFWRKIWGTFVPLIAR